MSLFPPALARLVAFCALAVAALPARGESFVGPAKCTSCHDHNRQATKWQREEPAALQGRAHFATLKQLDGAKAAGYAKAIGLADPFDSKGACVRCHATVFRGNANAGVSCESCHGAAGGFLDLHQQKGAYLQAVAAGMRDLHERPAAIARLCIECHVTSDARLAAAGHPTGADFDAGVSLQKLVHWKTPYDSAAVSAEGHAAAGLRLAALAKSTNARPAPAARLPKPAASSAAAPWDWDQPVRALPEGYVPEPTSAATPAPVRRAAPLPKVPPSIADEAAVPPPLPGIETPLSVAVEPVAAAAPAGAREPAAVARIAAVRGLAVKALAERLRAGVREPDLPAPATPVEFKGPDSELLRLQDEVLALAIEALRRPR